LILAQVDGIKILEGLAASGLRTIRYALEIEGTGRVDANDLDSDAVEAMKRNIQFNGAEAEQRMRPLQGDARVVMLQSPLVSPISIICEWQDMKGEETWHSFESATFCHIRRPESQLWWSLRLAYNKPSLQAKKHEDFRNIALVLHVALSAASFVLHTDRTGE